MANKKIIIAIIAIGAISLATYQFVLRGNGPKYVLAKVQRGEVLQEVSETGAVRVGEAINLGFKNSGTIENIDVEVGDNVKDGEVLARLETSALYIQLQESKSVLAISQAKLDKLLAGASLEEIQQAKTTLSNAEVSLAAAKQNLENKKAQAQDSLDASYEDALNVLDDAYLKAYNAQNTANSIERAYFAKGDQESVRVKDNRVAIEGWVAQIKFYLDKAKEDSAKENIDTALAKNKEGLGNIYDSLRIIREICEEPNYRNIVSSTDKTSLDTQKTNINTALTSVANSSQTISSTKLANDISINTAQTTVSSAEGEVLSAKDALALLTAPPREEDVDLYRAQVVKDEAGVRLLEKQIQEAALKSPVVGKITEIKKRAGEVAQSALKDIVIIILPDNPFDIKVDIYEEDVVRVEVGNPVDISLVALPDKIIKGKLASINPAEKIIDGVVYYEASVSIEDAPSYIKPGMTADLIIKAISKENILRVPEEAVQKRDGKTFVQVLKNGKPEEKEITVGLWGTNDFIEAVSGLSEGEEVIIQ